MKNKSLLHQISEVINELQAKFPIDHIVVGGDFNLTPNEWLDRWPARLSREEKNPIIENVCYTNKLIDIWRVLSKDIRQFTWFKTNGQSKYWLASNSITASVGETEISRCILSDHCNIHLKLKSRDYWKFNSQLSKNRIL